MNAMNAPSPSLSHDHESDAGIEPGAVALIAAPWIDELAPAVVLRATAEAVTVVPLSEHTTLASDWDMPVSRALLGYEAIAQIWNLGRVLPEQVAEVPLALPRNIFETLVALVQASLGQRDRPAEALVGPHILGQADPRLLFHDEESERMHVYWEQTLALAGVATVGQLVRTRREELEYAADELEASGLERGWIADLEKDTLDISATLTYRSFAVLMRRLEIIASQRLGRITLATIRGVHRPDAISANAGLAGRRGAHSVRTPEEYVARFLDELTKEWTRAGTSLPQSDEWR